MFPNLYYCQSMKIYVEVNSDFSKNKHIDNTSLFVTVFHSDNDGVWWIHPKIMGKSIVPVGGSKVECTWPELVSKVLSNKAVFHESCKGLRYVQNS